VEGARPPRPPRPRGPGDHIGQAILRYQLGISTADIFAETTLTDLDVLPVRYLFRDYPDMPALERRALDLCAGPVLDVGCGAGSHALYLQDRLGLPVTALDRSPLSTEACRRRGVRDVVCKDIWAYTGGPYATILLLMNGAGICGTLRRLPRLLTRLGALLAPGGQILLDSGDLINLFDRDEDGAVVIPAEAPYYGEVAFTVHYEGAVDPPFPWLYVDPSTLSNVCAAHGFRCDIVLRVEDEYLARITPADPPPSLAALPFAATALLASQVYGAAG